MQTKDLAAEAMDHSTDRIEIDTSMIPEGVSNEICRLTLRGVRNFFSNMTPEQKADFERWKAEREKRMENEEEAPCTAT